MALTFRLIPFIIRSKSSLNFTSVSEEKIKETVTKKLIVHESIQADAISKTFAKDNFLSIFYDPLFMKFINQLMRDGDKQKAIQLVFEAFRIIKFNQLKLKSNLNDGTIEVSPYKIFKIAMENVKPLICVESVIKNRVKQPIPVVLSPLRSQFLANKWMIDHVKTIDKKKHEYHFSQRLADQLINAHLRKGAVYAKKIQAHKAAEQQRAFVHFRW